MYSGIHSMGDMFNSYFSMCYLFLFDVVAKGTHDVMKDGIQFLSSKRSELYCISELKREGGMCMCRVCAFR